MAKVDSEGSTHLDEVTARAANRVSGLHVAVGHVKVLTDGDIGAYCDQFCREVAARRSISQGVQHGVQSVLDPNSAPNKQDK